jgi:hypothetical protein
MKCIFIWGDYIWAKVTHVSDVAHGPLVYTVNTFVPEEIYVINTMNENNRTIKGLST